MIKEPVQNQLRNTIDMCNYYLNNYKGRTSKSYYERLRKQAFKELIQYQLETFDRAPPQARSRQ